MTGWLDAVIQGVLLGGLYALFAAGLSLMFGVMRLVNLAHGDLIVLAAFAIFVVASRLGLDPFVAVVLAAPILFAIGFALQYVLLNRTLGRDLLPPLLVTFGLSIIIQNALLQTFSADSRRLRSGAIETASIPLGGGIAIGVVPLLTLLSAIAVIIVLRFGFVPLACAIFTINLMANVPFSADFSAWYMPASILALFSVVALAGWGFYNSLGGEPLWSPELE